MIDAITNVLFCTTHVLHVLHPGAQLWRVINALHNQVLSLLHDIPFQNPLPGQS